MGNPARTESPREHEAILGAAGARRNGPTVGAGSGESRFAANVTGVALLF